MAKIPAEDILIESNTQLPSPTNPDFLGEKFNKKEIKILNKHLKPLVEEYRKIYEEKERKCCILQRIS